MNNKGAALISSLCVLCVLVVLSLSMLLSTSVLITQATNKQFEEQCKVSAVTMAKEIDKSLYNRESGIYTYIKTHLNTDNWPYYNPDELGHGINSNIYKYFSMQDENSNTTGEISLRMHWEWERDSSLTDALLIIEVTSEKGSSKHIVKSTYNLSVDGEDWDWSLGERS